MKQGKQTLEKSATTTGAKNGALSTTLNFASDAGKGLEGTGKADFAIPFLTMLQGLSPQVTDGTVPGAKAGMLMNSITNELYDKVLVVPCAYQRRFVRWAPRSTGGGYRGELSPLEVETGNVKGMTQIDGTFFMDVPKNVTQVTDKDGRPLYDHLADTRNHFVLVQSKAGSWQPALLALASTQIKKSKKWMSRINGLEMKDGSTTYTPPSFSHTYLITAEKESNARGEWYGYNITLQGPLTDKALYEAAKKFHTQVVAGAVKVSQPAPDAPAESGRF